ncbi:MAG: hypothetical protein LC785_02460 [Acidobacteria bacterium]|nr:hypothetical protein [Acidobacteriota bacterium]MCA1640849.1 hypothetical protein [Acidobacteriota bacterium]
MATLPVISGEAALRAFERAGWSRARQKGSHVSIVKPGVDYTVHLANDVIAFLLQALIVLPTLIACGFRPGLGLQGKTMNAARKGEQLK